MFRWLKRARGYLSVMHTSIMLPLKDDVIEIYKADKSWSLMEGTVKQQGNKIIINNIPAYSYVSRTPITLFWTGDSYLMGSNKQRVAGIRLDNGSIVIKGLLSYVKINAG